MAKQKKEAPNSEKLPEEKVCGLVMPISAIDGCEASHWLDVQNILSDAIKMAEFTPNMVSDDKAIGVIHKRIIQNLYENPIVVCDVSAKNPNVMFELGLRLAFDKPAIIVIDYETKYSFDTSLVEHLSYPRDLRFPLIEEFKEKLSRKIKDTYEKSVNDPDYSTFLGHFGSFDTVKIEEKEVPGYELLSQKMDYLMASISSLQKMNTTKPFNPLSVDRKHTSELIFCFGPLKDGLEEDVQDAINRVAVRHPYFSFPHGRTVTTKSHLHYRFKVDDRRIEKELNDELSKFIPSGQKPCDHII